MGEKGTMRDEIFDSTSISPQQTSLLSNDTADNLTASCPTKINAILANNSGIFGGGVRAQRRI